ncbi:Csu type fimbrial protein [Xylophilus ampelinus]|uniref:Spore coat protein U-like protein n=2 Tax=Xylophilus ampelinus TaxID=54067 RepID=A0A318SJS5_9BURK|nr:spore coat U domain-containing protein [Xylophilus ampelinus]PYE76224.1 spore coat protein U-like protein [Xylophilus ampelinus]
MGTMAGAYPAVRRTAVRLLRGLGLLALATGADTAAAACTAAETGGGLGGVPSQRVVAGPAVTGQGNFQLDCPGVMLAVLSATPTLRATIVGTAQGRLLKDPVSGFTIPYQLTGGNGGVYSDGLLAIDLSGTTAVGFFTGGRATLPINIATTGTANVPAGTYEDVLTVQWAYTNLCQALVSVAGLCAAQLVPLVVAAPLASGTLNRSLRISLTVTNDCAIAAPNLAFGTAPLPSGFPALSQAIRLTCTRNMLYTVGLGPGTYPAGGRRQMAAGGNRLAYDIFRSDNSVWGTAAGTRSAAALADGLNVQTIPYTARVYPDQPAPPVGDYADNVVVDVQF